jgi:hypothetical protein
MQLVHIHMRSLPASDVPSSVQTAESDKKWAWPTVAPMQKPPSPKSQPRATKLLEPHRGKEFPTSILGVGFEVIFGRGRIVSEILTGECFC